jgi:hypothetical protein
MLLLLVPGSTAADETLRNLCWGLRNASPGPDPALRVSINYGIPDGAPITGPPSFTTIVGIHGAVELFEDYLLPGTGTIIPTEQGYKLTFFFADSPGDPAAIFPRPNLQAALTCEVSSQTLSGPGSIVFTGFVPVLDLVVANGFSDDVSVLLGNGNGSFSAAAGSPVMVGTFPLSVAVADLNGDVFSDLVVPNFDSDDVSVLLGNRAGAFTPAAGSPVMVGDGPWGVVADVNGDTFPDLLTANFNGDDVSVLLGNGAGAFTPAAGSPVTVGDGPAEVAVADLNGDTFPDLITANQISDDVSVLLGNGAGAFTPAAGSPAMAGDSPISIGVADVNGDTFPDLLIANLTSNDVSVLLGNGAGAFAPAGSPVTVGDEPLSIAVADLNGDTFPDFVTANRDSDDVSVLLGNGAGAFTPASGSPVMAGDGPQSVAVADLNGDTLPDFVTANAFSDDVSVLLGNGAGAFVEAAGSPVPAGDGAMAIAVAELEGKAAAEASLRDGITCGPVTMCGQD